MPEFYDAKKVKAHLDAFSSLLVRLRDEVESRRPLPDQTPSDESADLPQLLRTAQENFRYGVEHYIRFLETTHDGLWVLDNEFVTTYVNRQACEMVGRQEQEILGHHALYFACEHHLESLKVQLQSRLSGQASTYEHCLQHADGSEVWVVISATPLYEADGHFSGTLALIRNVTEQKRIEEALRLNEQRMRRLLDSLCDLVWSTSSDFQEIYYLSPATMEIYGRPPEDFFENHLLWLEVVHPDDASTVKQAITRAMSDHLFTCEYRVIWPDQSVHWVFARAWLITDDSGTPVRADGIIQNITARRRAEAEVVERRHQLHEIVESLSESFYLLDHDLRIIYVNPAGEKLMRTSADKIIGRVVDEVFPPLTRPYYTEYLREALRTGETAQYGFYYGPLGLWGEVRAHPVSQGLAVHTRDVTVEKEAMRHKQAILDGMASQIALLDEQGKIIEVNRAWSEYTEQNGLPGGGIGFGYLDLLKMGGMPVDDLAEQVQSVMSGAATRYVREHRCLSEGKETWWRFSGTPAPLADGYGGAVVVHTDITETKIVEAALAKSEERYALAAEGANDGLFEWDITQGQLYLSPRWKEIVGYQSHELTTDCNEWLERLHPEDRERVKMEILRNSSDGNAKINIEYRIRKKDHSYCWVLCRAIVMFNPDGKPIRMVGSISDITDRKRYEDRLAHNAMHDPLTSLPNRLLLAERLERAMDRFVRNGGQRYAVLFLDLDNFKHVNDSLGHQVGDKLLIELGDRLQKCVRPHDTVARLGGDEFALLLEEITGDSAAVITAKRIQAAFARPFYADSRPISVTASIGIVIGSLGHRSPVEVLRDADTAMYKAKAAGRNDYTIFDEKMHQAAMNRLELENDLYKAIELQQFVLYYQPIVDITTQKLKGFEALVRWNHPEKGLLSPQHFIPLAEETGQIIAIGEWITREACRQFKDWQTRFPALAQLNARISINVSARQFAFTGFANRIAQIVTEGGLTPTDVNLELTESALLENPAGSERILAGLRKQGFMIHLDDFGTGFSSLAHLQLPIDTVKIDRRFVSHICSSNRDKELVRGIIKLAVALDLGVVAEGVETRQQVTELQNLNCPMAQGYYYAKPLSADAVVLFLRNLHPEANNHIQPLI